MNAMNKFLAASAILSLVLVMERGAHAAGFEKVTTWSGRYAAVAGAAVSHVEGAESLYFNPAGLAGANSSEVSLNFSPTFGQYEGPIVLPGQKLESSRKLSPAFGALASYRLGPALGVGAGAFVSGGTKAIFEGVDFTANPTFANLDTIRPDFKSDLNIVEFSLGAGIAPVEGLRLGAAWRIVRVGATLATAQQVSTSLVTAVFEDFSETKFNGMRFGAQYVSPERDWGLGVNWRNGIDFTAEGEVSSRGESITTAGGATDSRKSGKATISSTFPMQAAVGGYVDVMKSVRLIGEYVWTEYHKNQALGISGNIEPFGPSTPIPLSSITLNWQNQVNIKGGVECTALEDWTFRGGYAFTSQVTPKGNARAPFASPGNGNTITLGAGTSILDRTVDLNGAAEYSFASGTVVNETTLTGDYSTNVFVFHLGMTYRL
ncbi:MAG: outer membrane protein transport protein [Oligoflexia bacterium]|nr:outer membrane protein transport protein [Oligoflexia bacterium]